MEDIKIHQEMRYPLIHTKKKDIELPKEGMVPNKPSPLQSFMMAQSTKKKWLAFHKHTLDKDHKMSVLEIIG